MLYSCLKRYGENLPDSSSNDVETQHESLTFPATFRGFLFVSRGDAGTQSF